MSESRLKAILSIIQRPELHPTLKHRLISELKAQGSTIRLKRVSMAEVGQLNELGLIVMLY